MAGEKPFELGTVISTFDGPSTERFAFVLSTDKVRRGQFVSCNNEEGMLIGQVVDITRANRYFERAESVAEYEKSGALSMNFPVTEWEYTVALVRSMGVMKAGELVPSRSNFPASPGSKVVTVADELVRDFVGFEETGLNLGRLEHHNVEAKVNLTRLLNKHLAILAMSGAGKSYLASVLIEELLDRKQEHGRLAVIIMDTHGEYASFRSGEYASKTTVFDARKIKIATRKISAMQFADFAKGISGPQERVLDRVLYEMKKAAREKHAGFTLDDVIDAVEKIEKSEGISEKTKGTLIAGLLHVNKLRLFSEADWPAAKEVAQAGRLSVINLSTIDSQKRKQIIVAYLANKLFKLRKDGKIPPFVLIVEEAHNFAPEHTAKHEALSRGIITKIAREGRKFGASLCLISQRPVQLSTTALSQCNSNIILRITNPYDIDHIKESCEAIDERMAGRISGLYVGEAMLIGEAVNAPVLVRVRRRKSRSWSKAATIESMAKEFESQEGKKKEDVEAFL